jgi:hypothetical protein
VKIDENKDIALLKIFSNTEFPYLKMGDSSKCLSGDTVIAVGSPLSLDSTVTRGIISAIRKIPDFNITVIQTDAAVNFGNSGGPLINTSGEVVGINTLSVKKYIAEGLNFALSINDIKQFVNQQQPGDTQQAQQVIERRTARAVQEIREPEQEERRRMINEEIERKWQQEAWQKKQAERAERLKQLRTTCEDQAIRQIGFDPRTFNAYTETNKQVDAELDKFFRWTFGNGVRRDDLTPAQEKHWEANVKDLFAQKLKENIEKQRLGANLLKDAMKNCYKETP